MMTIERFARQFVLPLVETPAHAAALLAGEPEGGKGACPADVQAALKASEGGGGTDGTRGDALFV